MTFPFVFTPHDDTTGKMKKGYFSRYKGRGFSSRIFETIVCHVFFNYYLQYYPTQKHYLTSPFTPLSKSFSNYHIPLSSFNNIFI